MKLIATTLLTFALIRALALGQAPAPPTPPSQPPPPAAPPEPLREQMSLAPRPAAAPALTVERRITYGGLVGSAVAEKKLLRFRKPGWGEPYVRANDPVLDPLTGRPNGLVLFSVSF
jgi:hypothetical protein